MKKAWIAVIAVLCVALVCGAFYYVKYRSDAAQNREQDLTEVQKLITRNLESRYPSTPREVLKFFNRIITCYYKDDLAEGELDGLIAQALALFDQDLLDNNADYPQQVKREIADYKEKGKIIAQSTVSDSNDVLYKKIDGDEIAYIRSSYFVREKNSYTKTYQQYVLRKDDEGRWKILVFYQIDVDPDED